MREILRHHVFERFPLVFGLATGLALVLLGAWTLVVARGPDAASPAVVACAAVAAAALGGITVPRLGRAARHDRTARRVAHALFAAGFTLITLAAGMVALSAAFGALAMLLAVAGLDPAAGAALLRVGSATGVAALGGALAWGFAIEGRRVEVTQHRIAVRGLAPTLTRLRIAHLSDLHIGNGVGGARLAAIVDRTLAQAPDLIVLTGDLYDNDMHALAGGARELARLRAPLGVLAVLGNHDGYVGARRVVAALAEHAPGVRVLRDRWVALATPAPLLVAGLDDPGDDWTRADPRFARLDRLAAARPGAGPAILLVHRPEPFPRAAEHGFALVLAGHFHGGQVALPGSGGRYNGARLITRFDRGLYRAGDACLYVSRGLGFAGPRLRLGSRPEIAILELEATSA